MALNRCSWANHSNLETQYHDTEWGVPVHDDRVHFEFITLEGAQAGLSWHTILQKRENYRRLFDQFDPQKIALYDDKKIQSLLMDPGIIRNKLKVNSTVSNAQAFLKIQQKHETFDNYIWQFTDHKVIQNHPKLPSDVPANSALSDLISKQLKKDGFKFVGTTIIYSYLQAVGIINDHLTSCFCYSKS